MKGIVFTHFMEMVEETFGFEVVDQLLEETDLPSGGAYTAVGTYDHSEMVALVFKLSEVSKTGVDKLLKVFGKYLFGQFAKSYAHFFEGSKNAFDFLLSIENYIHVEVLKLYPDAELPKFETSIIDEGKTLKMVYSSERRMGDLAQGLIESALDHYQEEAMIRRNNIELNGKKVEFLITRVKNERSRTLEKEVGA